MNPTESNEPAAPIISESEPQEEAPNTASVSLGFILLKLKEMEKRSGEGEAPTTKELTELRTNVEEARRLAILGEESARKDTLTGLDNLRAFNEKMKVEMSRLERHRGQGQNYPLYAVKIDLDFFKQINDSFGHATGDRYLQSISTHMSKVIRAGDMLARIGGDEFVVLMTELDAGHVEQVKGRLLEAVLKGSAEAKAGLEPVRRIKLKDKEGDVSASMGFALFDGKETPNKLFERADYYSFVAKAAGRNAVVNEEMAAELDHDGKIREKFIASQKGPEAQ